MSMMLFNMKRILLKQTKHISYINFTYITKTCCSSQKHTSHKAREVKRRFLYILVNTLASSWQCLQSKISSQHGALILHRLL